MGHGWILAGVGAVTKPVRIQRKRTKGWKMPPNTIYVGRSSAEWDAHRPFANPFRVGGYFKIGRGAGHSGFQWLEAYKDYADASFTLIETKEQAVAWFRLYRRLYPYKDDELKALRGKNLACWCALDSDCHADVLLELANDPSLPSALAATQNKTAGAHP